MSNPVAPCPAVTLEWRTEPHPDPIIRSLIEQVEKLRRDNAALSQQLAAFKETLHGPDPR